MGMGTGTTDEHDPRIAGAAIDMRDKDTGTGEASGTGGEDAAENKLYDQSSASGAAFVPPALETTFSTSTSSSSNPGSHSTSTSNSKTPTAGDANLDVEGGTSATSALDALPDPYQLRGGVLSEAQLAGLRNRGPDKGKGKASRKAMRELERYQLRQNDLVPALLKPMEEHTEDAEKDEEEARLPVKIAIYASLYCNAALCVLQLYAALSSLSLSLIATGIDSLFDLGSNILLFYLHRKAASLDPNLWPVGGGRVGCIGNVVYGFLMGAVNLVVIVESARALIEKDGDGLEKFHLPSIIAVGIALGVKFALFLYCFSLRGRSSQVQVLWEDHRNDIFLNGFGIIMSTGGSKLAWWLDPMGAVIIGLGIIISWSLTVYREFALLAGKAAPHDFLQLVIYKAATFDEAVQRVDTVRAYHSGPNYFVEIDIVLDGTTPLHAAHDVGQALQDKIEALPGVERAFVHIDYEWEHRPEHRKAIKGG